MPSKREILDGLLHENETVDIVVDARHARVDVPQHLRGDFQLVLKLSRFNSLPLALTGHGIDATLTFSGLTYPCHLPWKAVYCFITERYIGSSYFPEDLPFPIPNLVKFPILFTLLVENNIVRIIVDSTVAGVDIPAHLRANRYLKLILSRDLFREPHFLTPQEIDTTLTFSGARYRCHLPWEAVSLILPGTASEPPIPTAEVHSESTPVVVTAPTPVTPSPRTPTITVPKSLFPALGTNERMETWRVVQALDAGDFKLANFTSWLEANGFEVDDLPGYLTFVYTGAHGFVKFECAPLAGHNRVVVCVYIPHDDTAKMFSLIADGVSASGKSLSAQDLKLLKLHRYNRVEKIVIDTIEQVTGVHTEPDSKMGDIEGLDEGDWFDIITKLDDEFTCEIPEDPESFETVKDLITFIRSAKGIDL